MKITNFKAKILYYSVITLFLLSLASIIVSCGPLKPKYTDLRKIPANAKEKRKKNIEEGRGFRASSMFERKKGSGSFEFASSNEMWRATLDLLDFTPLSNVDYSGGIVITDWFSESSDQDPIKITIRFLSNEIRADGLKIIIHKKVCKKIEKKDDCKIVKIDSTLGQEIKLAILRKAATIKDTEKPEIVPYYETGAGRPDGDKK
jgi:hypothetical protein